PRPSQSSPTRSASGITCSSGSNSVKPPEETGGVVKTARRMLTGVLVLLTVCLGVPRERALEAQPAGLIRAVGAVGMTVGNMERSIAFYSGVLGFEKVSDVEVIGEDYERLQGVFGLRMRVVRMRLGDEAIELTEYLTRRR